jgi:site-specific DNA recombinase
VADVKSDLYARKSSADEGRSVERQQRAWQTDCAMEGIEAGRTFVDPDFSASRHARRDRPEWAVLLEHIRSGNCEMLSLWEVSRSARDMAPGVELLDLCREHQVLIRIFGEDAQTFRPWIQRDRETLLRELMKAESEVSTTRSRSTAGTADAATQGRPAGPLLDGYRREYGAPSEDSRSISGGRRREIRQVINEERAAIYRAAAQGALNGVPLQFMARVLNAWQVPTASGRGEWTGHGLGRALLNPGLQGHRILRGQVVARNAWPAVIDEETAARLQKLLTTTGRRHHSDSSLKYMLSGALLCGACRHSMRGDNWKGKLRYECVCASTKCRCCRVTGNMDRLDDAISAIVKARLSQPNAWAAFAPVVNSGEAARVRAELGALELRMTELEEVAATPGAMPLTLVAATSRELTAGIEAAQKRLRALETPPALRGYDPLDLAEKWDTGRYSVGEKRAVVMALAEVVLSPVGRGGRWSVWRLAESRWTGDEVTWGEHWEAEGLVNLLPAPAASA